MQVNLSKKEIKIEIKKILKQKDLRNSSDQLRLAQLYSLSGKIKTAVELFLKAARYYALIGNITKALKIIEEALILTEQNEILLEYQSHLLELTQEVTQLPISNEHQATELSVTALIDHSKDQEIFNISDIGGHFVENTVYEVEDISGLEERKKLNRDQIIHKFLESILEINGSQHLKKEDFIPLLQERTFEAEDELFYQEDERDGFWIILEGQCYLKHQSEGILFMLNSGEFIALLAHTLELSSPLTCIANSTVKTLFLSQKNISQLFDKNKRKYLKELFEHYKQKQQVFGNCIFLDKLVLTD